MVLTESCYFIRTDYNLRSIWIVSDLDYSRGITRFLWILPNSNSAFLENSKPEIYSYLES